MISGHLDLTPAEFEAHYMPRLQEAITAGHSFVVGDAPGADAMAQAFLFVHMPLALYRERVTVYHCARFRSPRHHVGGCPVVAAGDSQAAKDRAMTKASDYDVAWVRPGKEKSGTADNLRRRAKMTGGQGK